jgi:ABC-2 type transport system ATP-binding protein
VITVEDFHKAYDDTVAVAGISFQVSAGEVLGLVGPNGAGKTTTLRVLTGIIPPSRGRLTVAGFDLERDQLAAKNCMAYVPDDPQLFPDLTVEQHLAFAASAYRVADASAKVVSLLDEFELTNKQRTPAGDLSRGMRQKLAICCAYLHDPQVILLDEPLTGLDPAGIRKLKKSVVERARAGAAVIISSHLLAMVEDICTHVLILHAGRQKFWGPVSELKTTFSTDQQAATLEEIFFRATGDSPATALVEG